MGILFVSVWFFSTFFVLVFIYNFPCFGDMPALLDEFYRLMPGLLTHRCQPV